ncbi:MAG: type VI secretion system tip protein VgrG [Gammaproteobacteria bacterium]|nr:type VI secretion system tip protein VgrG [Gammaproteobacteria bacterium]
MSDDRIVNVSTVFASKVHLQHMSGSEDLGRPFRYELELLSDDLNLDLNKQVGESLTLSFLARKKKRYFNGIVSQLSFSGTSGQWARYVAVLRPRLWFLTHSSDNRIFQEKTVPDILKDVFKEHGFSCKDDLRGTYRKREYCVQYGETDFDFVSRLMEEEGIYYYFEHADNKHDLILVDASASHESAPEYDSVEFHPPHADEIMQDHINEWELSHRVETQNFCLTSYNYEKSKSDLKAEKKIPQQHGQSGKEQYEYGRLYPEKADGTQTSKVRIEEQQANYAIVVGSGNVRGLCCGYKFALKKHPRNDQNGSFLIIGAAYELENSDWETGQSSGEPNFECSFSAINDQTPFRPARTTPGAVVRGPQTAVVVGPGDQEIWTDKFGRVKVQFHWDRDGKKDEKSSCWVRVAHALAGQNFGFVSVPRIGQEVVIDFLEGDPDQPIITGSVYNDVNLPPYKLPENKTQSGFKSRSSKSGTAKDFNELRFEDKKGAEEVYFHAERDFKRVVENDDSLTVGLEAKDKGDQTIEIHRNRTATLNEGDDSLEIKKGSQKVKVKKKINIEAGDELKIKVGQSELTMKKNGDVTIKGMKLLYKANNSVTIKGAAKVEVKGAQVKITGDAKTDVKGAMTKVEGSGILDLKGGGMAKLKGGITMIG